MKLLRCIMKLLRGDTPPPSHDLNQTIDHLRQSERHAREVSVQVVYARQREAQSSRSLRATLGELIQRVEHRG